MPMPPIATVVALIEADCAATGVTGQNHDFYVSIVTRLYAAIRAATVVSTGVAPPGGGAVASTSTAIT